MYSSFTDRGGHCVNCDSLRMDESNGIVVLCDGLNGVPCGDKAAAICSEAAFETLIGGGSATDAVISAGIALNTARQRDVLMSKASSTICALKTDGRECSFATVGDSRIYHFSDRRLSHVSVDDSAAYADFIAKCSIYENIRMNSNRSLLTRCLGDGREPVPHTDSFTLTEGDGIIVCSDGFWQYVFETEMQIDLLKSSTPDKWLDFMLRRLMHRSFLDGDNLTVVTIIN